MAHLLIVLVRFYTEAIRLELDWCLMGDIAVSLWAEPRMAKCIEVVVLKVPGSPDPELPRLADLVASGELHVDFCDDDLSLEVVLGASMLEVAPGLVVPVKSREALHDEALASGAAAGAEILLATAPSDSALAWPV